MYKVSVITTLYNYKHYIIECIDSFIKQDFKDSEMIIIDDNSKDKPYKGIEPYLSDRVKYIRLDKNYGYSYAKNIGIENARSDILVMLDADDMITDKGITTRYNKIQDGYDFVHGAVWDLSYKSNGSVKHKPSRLNKKWVKSKQGRKCYKYVHAQGVMLKRDIHKQIGLYDEKLRSKSDREMWARIFNHRFKIGYVSDYVSFYRRHRKQMHRSKDKLQANKQLQIQVLKLIEKRRKNLSGLKMLQ